MNKMKMLVVTAMVMLTTAVIARPGRGYHGGYHHGPAPRAYHHGGYHSYHTPWGGPGPTAWRANRWNHPGWAPVATVMYPRCPPPPPVAVRAPGYYYYNDRNMYWTGTSWTVPTGMVPTPVVTTTTTAVAPAPVVQYVNTGAIYVTPAPAVSLGVTVGW